MKRLILIIAAAAIVSACGGAHAPTKTLRSTTTPATVVIGPILTRAAESACRDHDGLRRLQLETPDGPYAGNSIVPSVTCDDGWVTGVYSGI